MLTLKQKRFCEYLVGECEGNATESAKRAGYSPQTAGKNTTNILKSKEVQEYKRSGRQYSVMRRKGRLTV